MGMEEQHSLGAARLSGAHMRSHSLTLMQLNRPVTPKQHLLLSAAERYSYFVLSSGACCWCWKYEGDPEKIQKGQPYSQHEGAVSLKQHHQHCIQDSFKLCEDQLLLKTEWCKFSGLRSQISHSTSLWARWDNLGMKKYCEIVKRWSSKINQTSKYLVIWWTAGEN